MAKPLTRFSPVSYSQIQPRRITDPHVRSVVERAVRGLKNIDLKGNRGKIDKSEMTRYISPKGRDHISFRKRLADFETRYVLYMAYPQNMIIRSNKIRKKFEETRASLLEASEEIFRKPTYQISGAARSAGFSISDISSTYFSIERFNIDSTSLEIVNCDAPIKKINLLFLEADSGDYVVADIVLYGGKKTRKVFRYLPTHPSRYWKNITKLNI